MTLLDGMIFSEQEFYQQQYKNDGKWGRAIILVVIFHVLIFAAAKYLPEIMHRHPLIEDVMTIDLVSMPEPQPVKAQPPETVVRQQPAPEPQPVAKAPEPPQAVPVEVADSPEPEPAPVPDAKPVSIRPLKRKIKKARDTRLEEEKIREQLALERIRKKVRDKRKRERALARKKAREKRAQQIALARARAEEKRAQEMARNARAEIAAVLREQQRLHDATKPAGGQGRRNRSINSALEKQYYMDLASRVQRLWVLPEIKKWSPALETIIEFTVLGDGHLANVKVAKSSGDSFFDRFARETVKKAAPMPPIPPVLKKNHLDLGFRLRPAGVQN